MNNDSDSPALTFHEVALDSRGYLRSEWVRLRRALWHDTLESLDAQLDQLHRAGVAYIAFLVCDAEDRAVAFAEASLRPYVNGCETSPVVFLEGIYVDSAFRKRGLARLLTAKIEDWGRMAGCAEFASDILAENRASHAVHLALGFTETEQVIYFRRPIR